jgi:UDP-N-acetylglucosamine acyltransferase
MSAPVIHPTAIIDRDATLGVDVEVGPFAVIGPGVEVGDRCRLAARVTLEQNVRLGAGVRVGVGTVIGGDPQDLKYKGEASWVEVGAETVIREYTTINRGTAASGVTRVGEHCFLMSYVHVAHDCRIGNHVIMANCTQLAGHVTIHDRATLSGLVAVHQFVTVGRLAFIGGCSRVNQDIPPFVKAVGNPVELYGLNTIGLQRAGLGEETLRALKRLYRLFFNSELNFTQAADRAKAELPSLPEVEQFLEFVLRSHRGVPA